MIFSPQVLRALRRHTHPYLQDLSLKKEPRDGIEADVSKMSRVEYIIFEIQYKVFLIRIEIACAKAHPIARANKTSMQSSER